MPTFKKLFAVTALLFALASGAFAQTPNTNTVLVLYDSSGTYGWIGGLYSKMLANLMGHFDLNYQIEPVENYQAGQMDAVRTTFYFGSVYDNTLPAAFKSEVLTTTNTVCWFKYNLWQLSWADPAFNAKYGFGFVSLDASGYSNIVYKGESFLKNQIDPELGVVSILDTNLVTTPATAVKVNADATTSSVPYVTHSGNLWYIADSPFEYMSEESRYLAFADILHDIVGINHTEKHTAVIRLEDVTMNIYTPAQLNAASAALKAGNTPFALAFVPVYNDPLGYYNLGVPLTDRISDAADSTSVAFLASVKNAINSGAQLIIHGYTHQYSSVANPFDGTSGDDFEFWRETFATNNPASPYTVDIYAPVPEDSAAWVAGRIAAATNEMISAGLPWVGWESPHYSASAVDNAAFANSFPLTMARVLYFDDAGHVGGQFFPYEINHDVYGQHIIPENLGNFEPVIWNDYPARLAADLIRNARKNLVIRDGCANSYFHGFYDVTNLTTIVDGIKALGYTFVPVSTALPVILTQPASRTNALASAGSFSVTLTGPSPFTYQWRLNGANLAGGTNALLTLVNIQSANAGNYDVVVANQFGAVTSLVAVLTVTAPPVITTQPQSRTNATGSSATFSVVATSATPITYQWRFAGVNISGATNSSYTIASVTTANAGLYSVVVANANGSATSANARLTVGTPPTITTQPANRTNIVGANVTFSVVATGTATLRYQWYFNGAPIAGRTSTTLQLTSVQLTNTGNYSVLVTNAYGSVTSANGYLFVGTRPVVTTQPTSRTVTRGASTTFNVTATGTAPLSYQWRFRGVNISGATTSSYTIPVVATTNAGGYSVIIANPIGTVSSTSATLTVL